MMKVKPALFDRVLENIRTLVAVRGDSIHPSIVVQFLIDKGTSIGLSTSYELGRSLGPDRIALNAVPEIPRARIDRAVLLATDDRDAAEPLIEEVLRRDRGAGLLQIDFAVAGWNQTLNAVRAASARPRTMHTPSRRPSSKRTADAFSAGTPPRSREMETSAPAACSSIRALKPLGNIHDGTSFAEHWNGLSFGKMRDEMREVLLMKQKVPYSPSRFEILKEPCVTEGPAG